jgi:iron complex transport system substrate-binding protein
LGWNPFAEPAAAGNAGGRFAVLAESAETRTIRHIGGVTVVPAHPRRICALAFTDELLDLGIQPAAASSDWRGKVTDYLDGDLRPERLVPQAYASSLPSFEAVAAAMPDLILVSSTDRHEYRQLCAIAPTIVIRDAVTTNHENRSIEALKRRLRDVAAALGRPADAEKAIGEFEARAAAARDAIAGRMRGKTFAFFRTREREWRLYGRRGDNGAEAVYDALQINAPAMVAEKGISALDPEALIGFDTDYLIIVGDETPAAHQTLNRLRRQPLWRRVTAIRENHVLELGPYRHWVASGLRGKSRMIAEVTECILGRRL